MTPEEPGPWWNPGVPQTSRLNLCTFPSGACVGAQVPLRKACIAQNADARLLIVEEEGKASRRLASRLQQG